MGRDDDRDLIEQALLDEGRASADGWVRLRCPLCLDRTGKADRRGALSINPSQGGYRCFKCGAHGRLHREGANSFLPTTPVPPPSATLAPVLPPDGYHPLPPNPLARTGPLRAAMGYLYGRGLTDELIRTTHIGACIEGRYRGRVIVPLLDVRGAWRGYVARAWYPRPAIPYLYPPDVPLAEILYNPHALTLATDEPVLVVEGVFDALAHWPHAVAVLGKPGEAQLQQLATAPRPVVFALDGDAWEQGWALSMRLQFDGQRAGSLRLPPCVDPDEIPTDTLIEAARRSVDRTDPVAL